MSVVIYATGALQYRDAVKVLFILVILEIIIVGLAQLG